MVAPNRVQAYFDSIALLMPESEKGIVLPDCFEREESTIESV
jgi:hypothetical protein